MTRDPCQVLGVQPTATPEEIKAAYRRLRQQAHPDRNPGDPLAADRFQEIQRAYAALTSPKSSSFEPQWRDGLDGLDDLGSVFDHVFGIRGFGGLAPSLRVSVPWSTALAGGAVQVAANVPTPCPTCHGNGCRACGGQGRLVREHRWTLRVPAGAADSDRLRLNDPQLGAVSIELSVKPPPGFRREGNDIHGVLHVPVFRALLGGAFRWRLWDGELELMLPEGLKNGAIVRLAGRGAVHPTNPRRGDLLGHVQVEMPARLTAAQRQTLAEWLGDAPPAKKTRRRATKSTPIGTAAS